MNVPQINRVAVVIEPREPYITWARELDDDEPSIDSQPREALTSVYLMEYDEEQLDRPLQWHWEWIFEEQLNSWCRDTDLWPQQRSYQIFREWFDIRIADLIFDLADGPVVHDDF